MMTQPPSRTALLASRLLGSSRPGPVPAMLLRNAKGAMPQIHAQDAVNPDISGGSYHTPVFVPGAGMFGAGATLPANPGGQIEPGVLPGADLPDPGNPGIVPSGNVTVNAGDHSGDPGYGGAGPQVDTFSPIPGEHWLGGRIVGTDPNTGAPIYDPLGYGNNLGGIRYTGVDRAGSGRGGGPATTSGNPFSVASKRAGHSGNYWVF